MPEDVFALFALAIVAGTLIAIVKAVVGYLSSRHQTKASPDSLTTSELMSMIREAVEEGTSPLAQRVEALEEKEEQRSSSKPLLEIEDEAQRHEEGTTLRQKVH